MSEAKRPPAELVDRIITEALKFPEVDHKKLREITRDVMDHTGFPFPRRPELVEAYRRLAKENTHASLERTIRLKGVRTDSGVAPITVLTKPYACPGKCVYCPTEARMPKSYVASEPAAARALMLQFDPYNQVIQRVNALERNGHEAKKIELIVKGGTWSAYPWDYREWFIKRCFEAANDLGTDTKSEEQDSKQVQEKNEKATYRIIGITIETRPDWINPREVFRLRELGVTRVELGVQALDDEILHLTKRGHDVVATVRATYLLKQVGFKIDYHFLPGQPGSSVEKDISMFRQLFEDQRFCPDMVKIYPCAVLPSAELAEWFNNGSFKPLEGEELIEALIQMQTFLPRYCRVSRLIRDFPSTEIIGGNQITNLRQTVEERMRARGIPCVCLRCREISHQTKPVDPTPTLFTDKYTNAGGTEYFLSYEDQARTVVYSFLRLRLPKTEHVELDPKTQNMSAEIARLFPELEQVAFVRELHTYGQALSLLQQRDGASQHKGFGQRLMHEAERIAREAGFHRLAVISGIGVREYYQKIGYHHQGTYMMKNLDETR
ncbi:tRNA uridine(34) 5-carboxymethylaminomethyl modification radical SAM/GNAT enzyme Elp3 [Candidatus Uhrbacteria bacterium]|nr:tRNA uridine(34) 5-carboxymethylaminomethyl modification radical SAM/GNAT enzyme Elp3 [Candidatus Uhrbacteria bacterium]